VENNLHLNINKSIARRAQNEQQSAEDWDESIKPSTVDYQGRIRQLGDKPIEANSILTNTNRGVNPIAAVDTAGGMVGDWVPRFNAEKDKKPRSEPADKFFGTIALLVTVERDWEYEVWLMTENLSKWKQEEPERSWDISYVKSFPREFAGTAWNAWGYPGFQDEGIFSGAQYGFVETNPTEAELGIPATLETKTLGVNQQLGISTPLFWDENNPAPLTRVHAEFTLNEAWFQGFVFDNYVEVTHLYKNRYGTLSLKESLDKSEPSKFPDDWWIYPYFSHDIEVDHTVFDIPVDVYRYAYSPDGTRINFNLLSPDDYITVEIPLFEIDGNTGIPLLDDNLVPVIGSSYGVASDSLVLEEEWSRVIPESCQEPTGQCVAETRLVESEERDFGVAYSWSIDCFNQGRLEVLNGETTEATIAVSAMPVNIQWDKVPSKLLVSGVPDYYKPGIGALEGGFPSTFEFDMPVEYSVRKEPEVIWQWNDGSGGGFKEMNYGGGYVIDYEKETDSEQWTLTGTIQSDPYGEFGVTGQTVTVTFNYVPRYISGNFGLILEPYRNYPSPPATIDGWVTFWPGSYTITYTPPTYRRYILFGNGVKDYGGLHDPNQVWQPNSYISVIRRDDTVVVVGGVEYWFAGDATIDVLPTEQLTVFQNGIQIYQETFEERYPVKLTGTQNIAEYKNFIHSASIRFYRQFKNLEAWTWIKPGVGSISVDTVEEDCNAKGKFLYDKRTIIGKLGRTKITEQNSDREPEYLFKYEPKRENGDEVYDSEVTPELRINYVHAGGKIYSGVHTKESLNQFEKKVSTPSPNHQYDTYKNIPKTEIEDALVSTWVVSPYEDLLGPDWNLKKMPPTDHQSQFGAIVYVSGDLFTSIGDTLNWVGTFESDPPFVGGAVWRSEWDDLPIVYSSDELGLIDVGQGIQWSNQHEYFVPRKVVYWGENISGRQDQGKWLNGWEPINTTGSTGILPSGEFRSLSLRHETTPVKLTYGIKGILDTVPGVNNEPLHFVFAYGAHYAVFGKVNNGLDDDENVVILKSPASTNLTGLLSNKQSQIPSNPPYPASYDYGLLMRAEGYSWGGFKTYVAPHTPGRFNDVHSINKQLPVFFFPFPSTLSPSGIDSQFSIGFRYVDPGETYTITIANTPVTKTGFTSRTTLINSFVADLQGIAPPGTTVTGDGESITITGRVSVGATPSGGLTGLETLTGTNDETTTPGQTEAISIYRIYFPGINAPYSLSIDGVTVAIGVNNAMSRDSALSALKSSLSAYNAEISGDYVTIDGVYEVFPVTPKDFNQIQVNQSVVATESTDRSWREDEIKWDFTPTCGVPEIDPLELCNSANISSKLKYDVFNYGKSPYARIDRTKNPALFSIKDPTLLNIEQPNRLLYQDFTDANAIVIEHSKDGINWEEITLNVKQINPAWLGATVDKINIIAIAPSVIDYNGANTLKDKIVGEFN